MSVVLVVGMPRSGTTLLAEQLNQHHDARIGTETGVLGFPYDGPGSGRRIWDASMHLSRLGECPDAFHDLDRFELLEAILQSRQDGVLIDKTPHHRHHITAAEAAYDDLRVVWCWRDPRDTYRSLQRMPWKHVTEASFARECRQAHQQYLDAKGLLGDRLWTHYHERFLAAPTSERRSLADWLGLPDSAGRPGQTFQAWENEWKAKSTQSVDPAAAFAWCRDPTPRDEIVARYVAPVIQYHGDRCGWPRMRWLPRTSRASLAAAYACSRVGGWLQERAVRRPA